MNATDTLTTLREMCGLLHETEKHFLRERGWLCRVGENGLPLWGKIWNGHKVECSQPHALEVEENGLTRTDMFEVVRAEAGKAGQ